MMRRVIGISKYAVVVVCLLVLPVLAQAQSVDDYINAGEQALFSNTLSGLQNATQIFANATDDYPTDPVVQTYRGLTRVMSLAFAQGDGSLFDVLQKYGFTISMSGDSLDTLDIGPPQNTLAVTTDQSPAAALREYCNATLLPEVDAALQNLNSAISYWNGPYILKQSVTGDAADVEVDKYDVQLAQAGLQGIKFVANLLMAYNLDITPAQVQDLFMSGQEPDIGAVLTQIPSLLTLNSGGGSALSSAKDALEQAAGFYIQASQGIRADNSTQTGAEEMISLPTQEEQEEEAALRYNIEQIYWSLHNGTVANVAWGNATDEQMTVNLNAFFDTPRDMRVFLPQLDTYGEPIPGTVGHGLGDNATLGGILPDMTQDQWSRVLWGGAFNELEFNTNSPMQTCRFLQENGTIRTVSRFTFGLRTPDWQPVLGDFLYPADEHIQLTYQNGTQIGLSDVSHQVQTVISGDLYYNDYSNQYDYWLNPPQEEATYTGQINASLTTGNYTVTLEDTLGRKLRTEVPYGGQQSLPFAENVNATPAGGEVICSWDVNGTMQDGNLQTNVLIAVHDPGSGIQTGYAQFLVMGTTQPRVPIDVFTGLDAWDKDVTLQVLCSTWENENVTYSTPVQVPVDQMAANIRNALQNSLTAAVMNINQEGGPYTLLDLWLNEQNYPISDAIENVVVTTPDGQTFTQDDLTFERSQDSGDLYITLPGSPQTGEYTFSVTTPYGTVNSTDTQDRVVTIPIVNTQSMRPSAGQVLDSPQFSWDAVQAPDGVSSLYYRLEIRDEWGSIVYRSPRTLDMTSFTVPYGYLQPGQQYEWRIRVTDAGSFAEVQNRSNSAWIPFSMASLSPAPPAIDLDGYGAVNFFTSNYNSTDLWVKVIDHDGISEDGSSHAVRVVLPDGNFTAVELQSYGAESNTVHYYGKWLNEPALPGNYTFMVTDPGNNTAQVVDTLELNDSLGIPDPNSFQAVANGTTPTFSWDPVPNATYYRVRIYNENDQNVWTGYVSNATTQYTVPPGILAPNATYRYRIEARDSHMGFDVDNESKAPASSGDNPAFTTGSQSEQPYIDLDNSGVQTWTDAQAGTRFSFWVKVFDAQGVEDIQSVTVTTPTGETYDLDQDHVESGSCAAYARSPQGDIQSGTYTFTATDQSGNTDTVDEVLNADPIMPPARDSITTTTNGTAVHVDWADVDGAAFYRLEFFDQNYKRIYAFPATESEYDVPAGFLKAGKLYHYAIKVRREFLEQNVDNGATAPGWNFQWPSLVLEPQTGTHTPSVDLGNWGAAVWHQPDPGENGQTQYWLTFLANVTDLDGLQANGVRVQAVFPDGNATVTLQPDGFANSTTAEYWAIMSFDNATSIPQGKYTFQAVDSDGNNATIQDDLDVNPVGVPANVTPTDGSSLAWKTPAISWDALPDATSYRVRIYAGVNGHIVHTSGYLDHTAYTVPDGLLKPGGLYSYRVYAYREGFPDNDLDNLSSTAVNYSDQIHFTTGFGIPGDVDGDQAVTLKDGIVALKAIAGLPMDVDINPAADVNGDKKLGNAEAGYVLRELSGLHASSPTQ